MEIKEQLVIDRKECVTGPRMRKRKPNQIFNQEHSPRGTEIFEDNQSLEMMPLIWPIKALQRKSSLIEDLEQ